MNTLRLTLLLVSLGVVTGAAALSGVQAGPMKFELAADWPTLPAGMKLDGISAIASDSKDNLYLLNRVKPHVLVLDNSGKFLRSWNGDFKTPHGLRIDADDNLWIADMANHLVQKFSPDGKLLLSLGMKNKAGLAGDRFNKPADALVGPEGEIFVADGYGNSRIARFSKQGKFLRDWGKAGKGPSEFNIPHVVQFDGDQRILVGDRENLRVQVFNRDGKLLDTWTNTGAPYGLAVHKDCVYLADGRTGAIRVLDKQGKLLTRWQASTGKKETPHWIHVDRQGAVYVGFVSGKKAQKWVAK